MQSPIVTGLAFGESVRWHRDRVWFCDWVDGAVVSVRPDGSDRQEHVHLDGFPICIDWAPDDTLLVVDGAHARLLRVTADNLETSVDLAPVTPTPWNEIASHPSGNVYVNGIGFDMMAGEAAAPGQIALVTPDGTVRLVADGLHFPNGMAVSHDGSTLYVAESHAARISSYLIDDSGDLGMRNTFAEIEHSAPDGINLAADGTLWYADVPNRHCRRISITGDVLETIEFDRGCFSCATSPDGTLFVAATIWDADTFSTRRGLIYRTSPSEPERSNAGT